MSALLVVGAVVYGLLVLVCWALCRMAALADRDAERMLSDEDGRFGRGAP